MAQSPAGATTDSGKLMLQPGRSKPFSAGDLQSCALRTNGTTICWSYNGGGQTGAPSGVFQTVSASQEHSCGVCADGTIVCWAPSPTISLPFKPAIELNPSGVKIHQAQAHRVGHQTGPTASAPSR